MRRVRENNMRIILHLDMDAFFAAVEEREHPELKGYPIVVGADPKDGRGRGVVSTASYAARKYGIGSGMPISRAWKLCPAPKCAYLPVDGKLYGIVSGRIMKVVRECVRGANYESVANSRISNSEIRKLESHSQFAPIEQVSIDEAYVELGNHEAGIMNHGLKWKEAERLARRIKKEILARERLTCSIGIGPNKLIAKIASDFKKPDGLTIVRPENAQKFLDPLPVRKLPGIGPKTEAGLARQGIKTIRDLRVSLPRSDELFERAHGIDNSPVVEEYAVKSLGHETTFEHDTRDQALLTRTLMELCDEVIDEARAEGVRFRTITVRVRFADFETHTSSHTLKQHTTDGTLLKQEALKLLYPYFKKKRMIRLIGVRVSNFKPLTPNP
ncbi:DNA polymerase IV [Candidatus Uhrbacteria bacterium]|nr:DNA polymerase IV [Candidatus Uhrbacteria bacterium]